MCKNIDMVSKDNESYTENSQEIQNIIYRYRYEYRKAQQLDNKANNIAIISGILFGLYSASLIVVLENTTQIGKLFAAISSLFMIYTMYSSVVVLQISTEENIINRNRQKKKSLDYAFYAFVIGILSTLFYVVSIILNGEADLLLLLMYILVVIIALEIIREKIKLRADTTP